MAINRREFAGVVGIAAAACSRKASHDSPAGPPVDAEIVRLASVPTAVEGNVLPELIKLFEQRSPYRVQLTTSPRLYDQARDGAHDLLVSHYGHRDAEQFVLDGLGEWPRTLFSNQMALIGPPGDPAGIRGLGDAGAAFRRIAATKSKFVLNEIDGVRYLTEILWHAAGSPDRTGWFVEPNASKDGAIKIASELGAYTLWGLTPFLRLEGLKLEPLVLADPLLQRMMVSIVVKPGGVRRANTVGATALQTFLLQPATQALIRTIHYPGKDAVAWVPAGRHNRTEVLPKS
ncbi:MAG: substrate-binding domain-containing protein [Kofleriaceae bacterium]